MDQQAAYELLGWDVSLEPERYQRFGSFVSIFASVEMLLKKVLRQVVGVDERTALAIFSGTRGDQACSFIRRCYEARGEQIPPALDASLARFGKINTFRNDLLHHMPDMRTKAVPIVTNASVAIREEAIRRTPFNDDTHTELFIDMVMLLTVFYDFPKTPSGGIVDFAPTWLSKALELESLSRKTPRPKTRQERKPRPSKRRGR